ncbi:hypothetical protein M406DRAFT_75535 [Cryphonectria parasitica EP155]|uniref:Uncharacterized protein n=1 Tax=Cryphonectria parasitica (strain ATCC 38755 / EP155) TaxID=660469 RepID=A0A9P5CS47_CRYP1|nr:uncharacterized protein M406DRAFT_75535 [Cryphonectria parasitica EP155]KAF3768197.1 hypothetical protein M406DRAFT_75535 [Cryphonectria parasitica EP155]
MASSGGLSNCIVAFMAVYPNSPSKQAIEAIQDNRHWHGLCRKAPLPLPITVTDGLLTQFVFGAAPGCDFRLPELDGVKQQCLSLRFEGQRLILQDLDSGSHSDNPAISEDGQTFCRIGGPFLTLWDGSRAHPGVHLRFHSELKFFLFVNENVLPCISGIVSALSRQRQSLEENPSPSTTESGQDFQQDLELQGPQMKMAEMSDNRYPAH